jgi:perosamine synthetase
MPVHMMGLPCDMKPIWKLAKKYKLKIIEDSCESMLAEYEGKKVGSLGDVGCFSTYVAHLLVTGLGGLSTTNNKKLALKIRSLMNHGRDSHYLNIDDDNVRGKELVKIISKRFRYVSVGHSSRCTEMEAALGLDQLDNLEKIVAKRQLIARRFIKGLECLADHIQLPTVPQNRSHSFMLFPILLKKERKEGLTRYLEKRGVETRDLMPLLNQPIYKKLFGDIEPNYPNALKIRKNGFYIGCHQYLSDEDISFIVAAMKSYFKI